MANAPLYQTVAADLRSKIESGELEPGAQLPAESALMKQYDVSRNTIRDAIRWLKDYGLIKTQPGRGTFVAEKPEPFRITLTPDSETGFSGGEGEAWIAEVAAQGRTPSTEDPRVEMHTADPVKAKALQVELGEQLVGRHQKRFIDGTPWSMQTSFYPLRFVTEGATDLLRNEEIRPGTVFYLQQTLGIVQASYTDEIKVRSPNENEISFFDLPSNGSVQVYETNRTAYDTQGNPFRHTVSVFPADRNVFHIQVDLPEIAFSQEDQSPQPGAS